MKLRYRMPDEDIRTDKTAFKENQKKVVQKSKKETR